MHELAITESVVAAVTDRTGDTPVERVTLEIGRLSGVVADSVLFCFDACTAGTPLAGASLEIVDVPGRAHCRTCDSAFELPDQILLCDCGSADVAVLAGGELRIKTVTLA